MKEGVYLVYGSIRIRVHHGGQSRKLRAHILKYKHEAESELGVA